MIQQFGKTLRHFIDKNRSDIDIRFISQYRVFFSMQALKSPLVDSLLVSRKKHTIFGNQFGNFLKRKIYCIIFQKSHDQKKCTDYLLNVLQQTNHYIKDQSTKVEKMINKKTDDIFCKLTVMFSVLVKDIIISNIKDLSC